VKWSERSRTSIATFLLPVVSLLLLLLVGEGFFRILGYGRAVQYDYSPELGWVHHPNQNARMPVGGWDVRIDAAGFRGPDHALQKSGDQFRILLLGDSYTFGWAVAEDSTYGSVLGRLLLGRGANCQKVEVINGGVNGYNTEQEIAFLRLIGLKYHPDLVIIAFTPNDIMTESETKTMLRYPALRRLLEQSALYQFLAPRIKAMVFARDRGAYTETMSKFLEQPDSAVLVRWAQVRLALLQLGDMAERDSFRLLIAAFPFATQMDPTSRSDAPQTLLRQLHSESAIPLVDLLPAFRRAALRGDKLFLINDPTRHPGPQGHAVAAAELFQFITDEKFVPPCTTEQVTHGSPGGRAQQLRTGRVQ
jgi:lysophospholipase L1-like esterase